MTRFSTKDLLRLHSMVLTYGGYYENNASKQRNGIH